MNNLLAAGERAGVRHQVILSIVGVDQLPQLVYYRAKSLQEDLLRQGPAPYSIVRATQFFEFMNTLVSRPLTTPPSACPLPASSRSPPPTSPPRLPASPAHRCKPSGMWPARISSPSTNSAG